MMMDVEGLCPMGCGKTLHVNTGNGVVHCIERRCPDPDAVTKLLGNEQSVHHVVNMRSDGGFTMKHPLRERLEDELFECELHELLASAPPPLSGKYLVRGTMESGYDWEAIG
jgi:hypothetical protein